MAYISDRDIERLKDLFGHLYNANENERNAAASRIFNWLTQNNVHPAEVYMTVGSDAFDNQMIVLRRMKEKFTSFYNEAMWWRVNHPEEVANAIKAQKIEYRWADFADLINERIGDGPNWYDLVAEKLGEKKSRLYRWQKGLEPIPDSAFDTLERMPKLDNPGGARKTLLKDTQPQLPKRKRGVSSDPVIAENPTIADKQRAPKFVFTQPVYARAAEAFLQGQKPAAIAEMIGCYKAGEPNSNPVLNKFWNSPPDKSLGVQYEVRESGPATWGELWELAATVWGNVHRRKVKAETGKDGKGSWPGKLAEHFCFHRDTLRPGNPHDPMEVLAQHQDKLDDLRRQYQEVQEVKRRDELKRRVSRLADRGDSVLYDNIVAAGLKGATIKEIGEKLNWSEGERHSATSRPSELQRRGNIFSIGRFPERGGDVWVASQFKDQYPEYWNITAALVREGASSR